MATRGVVANFVVSFLGRIADTQTAAGETGESVSSPFGGKNIIAFAAGTGANQADVVWWSQARVIAAATPETLDVYDFDGEDIGGGDGNDVLGIDITLAGIKAIYIKNSASSVDDLVIGGDGTGAAWDVLFAGVTTSTIQLEPGVIMEIVNPSAAGYDVTDTSNHLLKMNSTGGCTYDICIVGINT